MLRDFGTWVAAVLKQYWGWLPSSAVAAIIGLIANAEGWTLPRYLYVGIVALGFVYSFYAVWRYEYVANRNAPQLTVDWVSLSRYTTNEFRLTGNERVTISNTGDIPAIDVRLGNFSRESVTWHKQPVIQTLHAHDSFQFKPELSVKVGPNSHEVGYMQHLIAKEPVSVILLWSDTNGTRFRRLLTLDFAVDVQTICVDYGRISADRKN
jgi:hypothetical protein